MFGMAGASIAVMGNNRPIMGRFCLPKTVFASLGPIRAAFLAVGILLLTVWVSSTNAIPLPQAQDTPSSSFRRVLVTNNLSSSNTEIATDLAIQGPGYFVVHDPLTGDLYATRFGSLCIDCNGFLVTESGMKVQGFSDPALSVIGDLQINDDCWLPPITEAGATVVSFQIQTNGCIVVTFSDGTSMIRCQILLQNFQNPSGLVNEGDRCFGWSASAQPLGQPVAPGSSGTGWLMVGFIEQLVPELQLGLYTGPPKSVSQGVLVPTQVPTDLGIEGNGFFVLRRTNDNVLFATRAGAFYLDGSGYLVHYSGLRLQGFVDSTRTTFGDLMIDTNGMPSTADPSALAEAIEIDRIGQIWVSLSDGTIFFRSQILLQFCANPDLLARTNFDLYPVFTNTGLWSTPAPPLTGNLGWIVPGMVELNQFDTNLLAVRSHLNFFIEGRVELTEIPSNLAISGNGFFTVRDPVANILYATRRGDFQLDTFGHLVTTNGLRLQGFTNSDLTLTGDLTIDAAGASDPTLPLEGFTVRSHGSIYVVLSDGSVLLRGRVLLQNFRNLQGLILAGNGLYSNLTAALPIFTNCIPGCNGLGCVQSGYVESPSRLPAALHLLPSSGLRLFINNLTVGRVEASSDLIHWDVLGHVCGSDFNAAEFFDTPQTLRKFYRVVVDY